MKTEKRKNYITVSLTDEQKAKAEKIAKEQSRPLAQVLALIVGDVLTPPERAEVAELLTIERDGKQVNEIHTTGTPAALTLVKIFIWHLNDPKGVKVWQVINPHGLHEIKGRYCFASAGASYVYNYHFTGAALEKLPIF